MDGDGGCVEDDFVVVVAVVVVGAVLGLAGVMLRYVKSTKVKFS